MSEKVEYAVIENGGRQYRVSPGQKMLVNRIGGEPGDAVELERVLLVHNDDGQTTIGSPCVVGATVNAKILAHKRAPKIVVFKKQRRKGYKKKQGHRQDMTELLVEAINS